MFADWPTFLSSSTIHGLSHLPASRGLARLFWLSVVITGFGGASFLIVKSFRGWEESPISTSVSVLPITQITFPNLTVCPPRGTFTSCRLNLQPVLMADNRSLEQVSQLGEFIAELICSTSIKQFRRRNEKEGLTVLLDYNEERIDMQQPGDLTPQQEGESLVAGMW